MMRILKSLFVAGAAVVVVGGGTYAYFSAKDSASGTLATGTLNINLLNQNAETDLSFNVANLMPGGTALVNFDVKNDSTTGIQLRGAAFGAWSGVDTPDNTLVSVVRVERWNGSSWQTLVGDGSTPITGMFYDSDNGLEGGSLFTVPAGGKDQFQLTVKLSPSAGDKYQGKSYDASVKVQARQDGASTWPSDLESGF